MSKRIKAAVATIAMTGGMFAASAAVAPTAGAKECFQPNWSAQYVPQMGYCGGPAQIINNIGMKYINAADQAGAM